MRFHPRLPKDNAILMLLASFLIVILGISAATGDRASHHVKAISIVGAVALLVTYGVWLVDYIRSNPGEMSQQAPARISMSAALALLAIAGVGAAFAADWFVTALSPAMERIGVPKAFAASWSSASPGTPSRTRPASCSRRKANPTSRSR